MSEILLSLAIILIVFMYIAIIMFLLKDRFLSLFLRVDKKGFETQVHAEPSAKVRITGVVQTKKSKMQVEHDDAEITGLMNHLDSYKAFVLFSTAVLQKLSKLSKIFPQNYDRLFRLCRFFGTITSSDF